MSSTSPTRFAVWLLFFVSGVVGGFYYHERAERLLSPAPNEREKVIPLKTRVRGETTEVQLTSRYILVEWMCFDEDQIQSVCRASEILRRGDKIYLKDPVLYDYDHEAETVTRTSGNLGEATLKEGGVRELETVRIWGKAMIFRYKVAKKDFTKSVKVGGGKAPEPIKDYLPEIP